MVLRLVRASFLQISGAMTMIPVTALCHQHGHAAVRAKVGVFVFPYLSIIHLVRR
jgi:hypothetical protein